MEKEGLKGLDAIFGVMIITIGYHDHNNVVNILFISIISCGLVQSFERMPEIAGVIVDHIDHPGSNTKECGQ